MAEPITVILIDDHQVVREGVLAFLSTQEDILVVGEADGVQAAVESANKLRPRVALVDLIMEDGDGIEATRSIKQVSPDTQVVVLTSFDDQQWVIPALRAGALSYVLKDVAATDLSDVIRRAAQGEAVLHPRVAGHVVNQLRGDQQDLPIGSLTERELQVLKLVANGLNNAEIARDLVISEKTVKGHVGNILAKLHLADRTQAAVLAWRAGLIRTPGPS